MQASPGIHELFRGRFITAAPALAQKLARIKAFVFDWDGVFNDGFKNDGGSSPFSEIDSMGTNLLRFSHFLKTGSNPLFFIISGEKNTASFTFSRREHCHAVYFKVAHKADAFQHLSRQYGISPEEIAFFFDDVLDFSAAAMAGVRVMVPHKANTLLVDFAVRNGLADYLTACEGETHAVREATELLMYLNGNFDEAIRNRMEFSGTYREYLALRNAPETGFYSIDPHNAIQPMTI